jgi:hypothetical protein
MSVSQEIRLRPLALLMHLRPSAGGCLVEKLAFENLRQWAVRTCLRVLAIGVEVTMILTPVGIRYGTLDEAAPSWSQGSASA